MEKNFRELKDRITKAVFESVITGTKSNDFKKFVKEVKKSSILKEQLDIYNLVENEKFETSDDARFIFERAMRVFEKYTIAEIVEANKTIVESFGGKLDESEEIYRCIKGIYAKDSGLQNAAPTFLHVRAIINEMVIFDPYNSNKKEEIPVLQPVTKKQLKRATAILNEKFSFLNDTEKEIYKSFMANDNAGKEKAYNNLLEENIKLVKRKLFESEDEELDGKLNLLEGKLKEDKFTPEKKITDFLNLMGLSSTLI